jgi:nucleoside-diphosphate-sugar epimerase
VEDGPTRYGRLKAGCEAAVRAEFGDDKTMVVRPGVVLGPGEYVGRLPWWLRRVHAGGTVLAPGSPTREIQPIDVRDVADFILDAAAASAMGTFNLTAPVGRSTFDDLMQACRTYTVSRAEFVWIADELLVAEGVRQWSEVPLWRTQPGVWRVDSSAAMVAGLRCRPLAETVRDTWLWMSEGGASLVNDRSIEIGLSADREATLLASLA